VYSWTWAYLGRERKGRGGKGREGKGREGKGRRYIISGG